MDATYKTCKLALPLFFLVVHTNVGYSVVAEFIIQHEDTTSITEALKILRKRWDECDIEVGNFMIDCQQSEENAIRAVSVHVPPTSGMAPVARQHQKRSQQLSNVLYGTSECGG